MTTEVNLVTVVFWWVVTCRHNHGCAGVKSLAGEGGNWSRHGGVKKSGFDPSARKDFGRILRKDVGIYSAVVANNYREFTGFIEVLSAVGVEKSRNCESSLRDNNAVHAIRPSAQFAAKTCGSKLEARIKT